MKAIYLTIPFALLLYACSGQNNCSSTDIAKVDSCLIGKTIDDAIKTLGIDTFSFQPIRLFAREIYGIYIRKDSVKITIIVEKPYIMSDEEMNTNSFKASFKFVAKHKIQWICWHRNREYGEAGKKSFVGCQTF